MRYYRDRTEKLRFFRKNRVVLDCVVLFTVSYQNVFCVSVFKVLFYVSNIYLTTILLTLPSGYLSIWIPGVDDSIILPSSP